jgi:DNA polymerase-3 subunit beta
MFFLIVSTLANPNVIKLSQPKSKSDTKAKQNASFIVPKKPLNLLKNALPDNEDPITLSFNNNHLFVDHGSTQLICRLIDARFPDYKVVIPAENPYQMVINRQDFQAALRRISIFSNKSTSLVTLNITGSELQLTSQDIDFSQEGNERMSCQYDGEDITISFNARFLIEMLSCTDSDDVRLELSTPTKAGLLKPVEQEENEDLLMLAMPLMSN